MRNRFALAIGLIVGATMFVAAQKPDEHELIEQVAKGLKQKQAAAPDPQALKNWRPGHTAWGDPDLTGVYSNSEESGIPFERPAEFANRRLDEVSPAELAKLNQQHQDATINRAASANDEPNAHPQLFWWENLNPRNSRVWMVSDPPDGHIPPLTSEGQRRIAA